MEKMTLTGAWQFRQAGTEEWLPATVPGGVHTDLMALGKIPDPFVADNELKVMWVAETDWEYRRTFTADAALLAEPKVASGLRWPRHPGRCLSQRNLPRPCRKHVPQLGMGCQRPA